jgi:hypothetical protein
MVEDFVRRTTTASGVPERLEDDGAAIQIGLIFASSAHPDPDHADRAR